MTLIHHAVTQQALTRPDTIAIIDGDRRLTYREVDARANAYAAELAGFGIGPGHVVPVALPRGPRMLLVLLAVLKLGAAYAALDHRWPPAHRAALIQRLPASVLVTDDPAESPCATWSPAESPTPAESLSPAAPLAAGDLTGDSPATVFFTSGTSGLAKPVLCPHRAVLRLFPAETFADFGPGWVMPQTSAVAWDAFAMELWGMLSTGGTCVIPGEYRLLPDDLRELVDRAGVNQVMLSTSVFNLFVDEDLDCFAGIRRVLVGGERFSASHARRFLHRYPRLPLVNGYGPVENCVFATTHVITARDCERPGGIPLGRPVRGTTVHLLRGTEPVPGGEAGEICVSGSGLALGYLGETGAAAANFTTYRTATGEVPLYRTGDLGRLDEDGVLHFLGRADRQVKVGGHRIEPAELEARVRELPGVRDCAVVPVPGEDGAVQSLALFYTALPDGTDPAALRERLRTTLPAYLVPGVVRRVPELPLTSTGKADHRSLLAGLDAERGTPRSPATT